MSVKITIDVPTVPGTHCTVELPFKAIGAASRSMKKNDPNKIITEFTADITKAVLRAAGIDHGKAKVAESESAKPGTMLLYVRPAGMAGLEYKIRVPWYASVADVVGEIETQHGLQADRVKLQNTYYQTLKSSATLQELGITDGDVVHVAFEKEDFSHLFTMKTEDS